MERNGRPKVALVLPGGGARGAYEAGALSVLLPALAARGETVSIICGTSVGAINAAHVASLAHLPVAEQAEIGLERWRTLNKGDVIKPLLGPGLLVTALRAVGQVAGIDRLRLRAVLDASPLGASLDAWVDWDALHRNVKARRIGALCVVATALKGGGPVAFVETAGKVPADQGAIRYVRTAIAGEHVRGSAAIPFLFPPVAIDHPRRARDEYVDGGTRLNTPLKPALALGADRVIVIGVEPFTRRPAGPATTGTADVADVAATVLDGLLVDQVADDVHRLGTINAFLTDQGGDASMRGYRTVRGRQAYRRVPYALIAPRKPGELAAIAERVFEERYGGWRGLRSPDFVLLSRLLQGRARHRGELLSFLLFDGVFGEALIDAGARDAQRWLDRHPAFWCSDPAHDLEIDAHAVHRAHEERAMEEWRAMRRR
jgi:NTE family protein